MPSLFPPAFLRSLFNLMRGYGSSIRFPTLCGAQQGWQTDLDRPWPFPPSVVAMRRHPSFLRGDVLRNKTGGNCELLQGQLLISPGRGGVWATTSGIDILGYRQSRAFAPFPR